MSQARRWSKASETKRSARRAIKESLAPRDLDKYSGVAVGWIRRDGSTAERNEAQVKAKTMTWWRPGLVLDPRDQKFWVFREAVA